MVLPKRDVFRVMLIEFGVENSFTNLVLLPLKTSKVSLVMRTKHGSGAIVNDACPSITIGVILRQAENPIGDIECLVQFVRPKR